MTPTAHRGPGGLTLLQQPIVLLASLLLLAPLAPAGVGAATTWELP